jgi:hypothetical protein
MNLPAASGGVMNYPAAELRGIFLIKGEFDPQWVSHLPVPLAHDIFMERAKWMKPKKNWKRPKGLPK